GTTESSACTVKYSSTSTVIAFGSEDSLSCEPIMGAIVSAVTLRLLAVVDEDVAGDAASPQRVHRLFQSPALRAIARHHHEDAIDVLREKRHIRVGDRGRRVDDHEIHGLIELGEESLELGGREHRCRIPMLAAGMENDEIAAQDASDAVGERSLSRER